VAGSGALSRIGAAVGLAIAAAVGGGVLGALLGVPMSWGISIAVGLAVFLILYSILAAILVLRKADFAELKNRLLPNQTIETTKETIEWVREQMPQGRKS
jgi:phosphate/sulfate permease